MSESSRMEMSRKGRLTEEWSRLSALNEQSDYVRVKPLEVLPNRPPEKFQVSFRCKGIYSIDAQKAPVYGSEHQVEIYCHAGFPAEVPWLKWLSPIWHPNIEHAGLRKVCVNRTEWLGGMSIENLCQQLFEMIQYKNYHAELSLPYPLDLEAAAWVREFAEPAGIVNKAHGIFVDNLPFYRPTSEYARQASQGQRIRIMGSTPADPSPNQKSPKIKIQPAKAGPSDRQNSNVVLEAGATTSSCDHCGAVLSPTSRFCGKCGTAVRR